MSDNFDPGFVRASSASPVGSWYYRELGTAYFSYEGVRITAGFRNGNLVSFLEDSLDPGGKKVLVLDPENITNNKVNRPKSDDFEFVNVPTQRMADFFTNNRDIFLKLKSIKGFENANTNIDALESGVFELLSLGNADDIAIELYYRQLQQIADVMHVDIDMRISEIQSAQLANKILNFFKYSSIYQCTDDVKAALLAILDNGEHLSILSSQKAKIDVSKLEILHGFIMQEIDFFEIMGEPLGF